MLNRYCSSLQLKKYLKYIFSLSDIIHKKIFLKLAHTKNAQNCFYKYVHIRLVWGVQSMPFCVCVNHRQILEYSTIQLTALFNFTSVTCPHLRGYHRIFSKAFPVINDRQITNVSSLANCSSLMFLSNILAGL